MLLRRASVLEGMAGSSRHDDWAFLPKKTPVCGWDRRRKAKSREPISEVKDISMTECELQSSCPYYEGLIDMPEEYKEQYCRGKYQWCGQIPDSHRGREGTQGSC
jgi:hypothetical protein